jgi:hypothetical protein
MIKVDWCFTKSGLHCIGHFSLPLAYNLQIPLANGKHAGVVEEIL